MRLFLQIDIGNWHERGYDKPFSKYAPSLADDVMAADLDSESDPSITGLVIRLADQAEKIFVLVYADPKAELGGSSKLFNHLFSIENKIHALILCGKNEMAEKMMRPFQERFEILQEESEIKLRIEKFAKAKT